MTRNIRYRGANLLSRLKLESGAPLAPAAITGTEKLFFHGVPRPTTVSLSFGEAIPVEHVPATPEGAGDCLSTGRYR